jgi:hypothetical protein
MAYRGEEKEFVGDFGLIKKPFFLSEIEFVNFSCIPFWPINIIYCHMLGEERTRLNYSLLLISI